jgi:subtilase family serine protease
MQDVFKIKGQSFPTRLNNVMFGDVSLAARRVNRCRVGNAWLGGLAFVSLLLTSSKLFAGTTTVELSPLIYKSALVAPVDGNKEIGVALALPSSNPGGLAAFVQHVSTAGDPLYRRYITPEQFAQRFGGNAGDYQAVKDWAVANGLAISQESIGRTLIIVRGSVLKFESLFQTQLSNYRAADGQTFYSATVKPSVPAEIASKVSGVIGLTVGKALAPFARVAKVMGENPAPHSANLRADSAGGTGPGGAYSCDDLKRLYTIPDWGSLDKGVTVGVFEQGSYAPSDVETYFKKFHIGKSTKQTPVSVDGSPIVFEEAVETEACLDLDMFVGMNSSIGEVKVYIDDYQYDPFPVAMVAALHAMADEKKDQPQIISVSYGEDEDLFGTHAEAAEDTALQQLASEGVTVLAASGDNGAYGDALGLPYTDTPYNVACPVADPYILGVGGTTLFSDPNGNYITEIAWNELPSYGATGGGISAYWSAPEYQSPTLFGGVGSEYMTLDGGSWTQRNVPDVGAIADPLTGVAVYVKDQGGWLQVGGTSASSPIWAGYLSNINAALHWAGLSNLGFFNPDFYSLGYDLPPYYFDYAFPVGYCLSVDSGSNGNGVLYVNPGYTNGLLYNNTTGNGSIWGSGFGVYTLISGSQPGTIPGPFTITTPEPKPTSCKITWTAASNAAGYVILLRNLRNLLYDAFLVNKNATSFNFTGLTAQTSYGIDMFAFNASGYSEEPGNPVYFSTPQK